MAILDISTNKKKRGEKFKLKEMSAKAMGISER